MYILCPNIKIDRGFKIPKEVSVLEYVQNKSYYPDMLTSDRVIIVTDEKKRVSYGFDFVSAMILEGVLAGQNEAELVENIAALFKQNLATVALDIKTTINILKEDDIIKEV